MKVKNCRDSCRNRDASCIVSKDEYLPHSPEQRIIFKPILPPLRVSGFPPIPFASSPSSLNLARLLKALQNPTPRPAPLGWKSPGETLTPSPSRKNRARTTSVMNAQSPTSAPFLQQTRPIVFKSPSSPSVKKKPRLESKREPRSTSSRRHPPPPPDIRALNTVVYDHKLQSLLRCVDWMARTTVELPKLGSGQRQRLTYPTSDIRTPLNDNDEDESLASLTVPLPLDATPCRTSHYSLPLVPPTRFSTSHHSSPFRFALPRVRYDDSPSSSSSFTYLAQRSSSIESNLSLISNTTSIDDVDKGIGESEWWNLESGSAATAIGGQEKKEEDQSNWKAISW